MPLPVAHSLAGVTVWVAQPGLGFFSHIWANVLFVVFLANAPDLDFLPGYLIGQPNVFHHGVTHTFGAAILVGAFLAFLFSRKKGRFWLYFLVIGGAYYSHVFMDYLTEDHRLPAGVMMFWPFTSEYFQFPYSLFKNVVRSDISEGFFLSLFCWHNFWVALREAIIMGVVLLGVKMFGLKGNKALPSQ